MSEKVNELYHALESRIEDCPCKVHGFECDRCVRDKAILEKFDYGDLYAHIHNHPA